MREKRFCKDLQPHGRTSNGRKTAWIQVRHQSAATGPSSSNDRHFRRRSEAVGARRGCHPRARLRATSRIPSAGVPVAEEEAVTDRIVYDIEQRVAPRTAPFAGQRRRFFRLPDQRIESSDVNGFRLHVWRSACCGRVLATDGPIEKWPYPFISRLWRKAPR
jgi:hypothetical protein